MRYSNLKIAGTLFFVAASQFILALVVAEALYPSYSISMNYVSDLGVGPSSAVFNFSVFLMGILMLAGGYFLQRAVKFSVLTALLILTAIGTMGVGVFTEHSGSAHTAVSAIAFLFGAFSAIASYRLMKSPFSPLAIILGLTALVALILFGTGNYIGLGKGGMERMILYPILMWGIGFGAHLIGQNDNKTTS